MEASFWVAVVKGLGSVWRSEDRSDLGCPEAGIPQERNQKTLVLLDDFAFDSTEHRSICADQWRDLENREKSQSGLKKWKVLRLNGRPPGVSIPSRSRNDILH
jgi:hypothetical protein